MILLLCCGGVFIYQKVKKDKEEQKLLEEKRIQEEIKRKKQEAYEKCLDTPYQMDGLEEAFDNLFNEYKGTGIAIYFTDINNEYDYTFNATRTYYSASAIKLFDAIYLVEKAKNGEVDLNDTITYTASDKKGGSAKTSEHNFGDKIPLSDLISYALSVSDNAAHAMLVKYIGSNKMNSYFSDAKLSITDSKPYEYNYTATMANESLKRIYDIIKENDDYSTLIKSAMKNDYANSLNFDNVSMLHKYGLFDNYYHDIGINDSDNPYLVSILTSYGKTNYKEKVKDIHKRLYELYQENLKEKEEFCKKELA